MVSYISFSGHVTNCLVDLQRIVADFQIVVVESSVIVVNLLPAGLDLNFVVESQFWDEELG